MYYIKLLTIVMLIVHLSDSKTFADARPPYRFTEFVNEDLKPNPGENIFFFIRKINDVVAEATLGITIEHENISELDIFLTSPNLNTIQLLNQNTDLVPTNDDVYSITYDYPQKPITGSFKSLSGIDLFGRWLMEIDDLNIENDGTLRSWFLEIAPAILANFDQVNQSQELQIDVDGYGSFGDQSYHSASNLGAKFRSNQNPDSGLESTIYHSALFSHNHNRYISSLDMYPGNRLPTVTINQLEDNQANSDFALGDLTVSLNQYTERTENDSITLVQEYTFKAETFHEPLLITRYINPKFRDNGPPRNYAAIKQNNGKINSLFVFDNLIQSITEETRYVSISQFGDAVSYHNHSNSPWFLNTLRTNVSERLLQRNLDFYDQTGEQEAIADGNNDNITDPGQGFDVALMLASKIEFNSNNVAKLICHTTWGTSSPADLILDDNQTKPTPTPINRGLRAFRDLPDLRAFLNIAGQELLDLDEYVKHGTIPNEELNWSIVDNRGLPLRIDQQHRLIIEDFPFPGNYGNVILRVSDGKESLLLKTAIKLSTMMSESFFPADALLLSKNNNSYTSDQSLDDYLHSEPDLSVQQPNIVLQWQPGVRLPDGVESIEILDDNRFSIKTNDDLKEVPQWVPFRLAWATFTPTPDSNTPTPTASLTPTLTSTQTPSPTHLPTQSPTFSPTITNTPTLTPSQTPTSTNTPTQTPSDTPTQTNIPTQIPSNTSTPTMSNTPTLTDTPTPSFTFTRTPTATSPPVLTRTATPSPTPDLGCNDFITLRQSNAISNVLGPSDWLIYEDQNESKTLLLSAELDSGQISVYESQNQIFSLKHKFAAEYGVSNIAVDDLNANNQPDLVAYNPIDGALSYYENIHSNNPQPTESITIDSDFLPDPFDTITTNVFRALAMGKNAQGELDVIIRGRNELLVYQVIDEQWQNLESIELNAETTFIVGHDLDRDLDMDLIVGTRMEQGSENIERVLIYENSGQGYELVDEIRTDETLRGNFAREAVVVPGDDNTTTIALLLFSGQVAFYQSANGLNFDKTFQFDALPPGLIESISFAELTGDSEPELLALFRGQDGLSLYAVCGNTIETNPSFVRLKLSNFALEGQLYKLGSYDFDGNGKESIILSRSFRDQISIIENIK